MVSGVRRRPRGATALQRPRSSYRQAIREKTEAKTTAEARIKRTRKKIQKVSDLDRLKTFKERDAAKRYRKGQQLRKGRVVPGIDAEKVRRQVSSDAAQVRVFREVSYTVVRPTTGRKNRMPSSWIKGFAYDSVNQIFYMTVKNGKMYQWDRIHPSIAMKIIRGEAACRTTDSKKRKRWWVGKSPSAGAAYWKYLAFSR